MIFHDKFSWILYDSCEFHDNYDSNEFKMKIHDKFSWNSYISSWIHDKYEINMTFTKFHNNFSWYSYNTHDIHEFCESSMTYLNFMNFFHEFHWGFIIVFILVIFFMNMLWRIFMNVTMKVGDLYEKSWQFHIFHERIMKGLKSKFCSKNQNYI